MKFEIKIYPARDLCQEVEDCGRTSRVNFDLPSNGALRSCNDQNEDCDDDDPPHDQRKTRQRQRQR